MAPEDPHCETVAESVQSGRCFRWKIAAAILLFGALTQTVCWFVWAEDLTHQILSCYFVVPPTAFLLVLWWAFLSGFSVWLRVAGIGTLAMMAGLFGLLFQVKFDGAMRPLISLRSDKPELKSGADGERSPDSFKLEKRRKANEDRFTKLTQSVSVSNSDETLRAEKYTPAEFLRLKGRKNWQELEKVDGLAVAGGCSFRALFRLPEKTAVLGNWPNFRGPNHDGSVRDRPIRIDFSEDDPPRNLWPAGKRVGAAWSSFAVADSLAYTMEQRGHDETTVCYDLLTGAQVWTNSDSSRFSKALGGTGPRATPTIYGGLLYTLGAKGALNCRDLLTGKRRWKRSILADADAKKNLVWGMSASPLVAGNLVFVNAGTGGGKAVLAYHRLTGKIVWATGNEPASYSTPVLARIHGTPQLLVFNGIGLVSYDPNTGRELWKYDKFANGEKINVAQPIVHDNRVFLSSGYSAGSALLKVSVTAGKWSVSAVWVKQNRFRLKFNDGVYKSDNSNGRETGYIYGLDETILTCIEFNTGEIKWRKRGKFGYGQLLLIGDVLLVSTEKTGEVVLFPATPTRPTELTRFRALNRHVGVLGEKGSGWNHPVITDGLLLIRNDREAACYDLRKSP